MQEPQYPYPFPAGVVPRREFVGIEKLEQPPEELHAKLPTKADAAEIALKLSATSMAMKYPRYFKDVSHLREIDVYQVHKLFGIDDPSGALQHASKKLLLSGVRTGGKSKYEDIREARDTLNRWLEIHQSTERNS